MVHLPHIAPPAPPSTLCRDTLSQLRGGEIISRTSRFKVCRLGGNCVLSLFTEMGLCGSKQAVYIDGLTPYEYYQDEWKDALHETYSVLHLTPKQGYQIYQYFVSLDKKGDGEVTVEEFHDFFKLQETPFSNRGKSLHVLAHCTPVSI